MTEYTGPDRRFTPRQEDVIAGLCGGLSPKAIAIEYQMSVSTIRWHIDELRKKLPPEYSHLAPTKAIVIWAFKTGRCW